MAFHFKIADAIVSFVADLTGLKTGLSEAEADTKKSASKIAVGFARFARIAIPAALGVTLVGLSRQALIFADDMGKASEKLGSTAEDLSRLDYAAQQNGVAFDELSRGLSRLTLASDEAMRGNKAAADEFSRASITLDQLSATGGDATRIMALLAESFATNNVEGSKTAVAMSLLGQNLGVKLIPLLNKGKAGLEGYAEAADRTGYTVSSQAVAATSEFNDQIQTLRQRSLTVASSMTQSVIPAVQALADAISKVSDKATGGIGVMRILDWVVKALSTTVILLLKSAETAIHAIGFAIDAAPIAMVAATGRFKAAASIWDDIMERRAERYKQLGDETAGYIEKIWGVAPPAELTARGGGGGKPPGPDEETLKRISELNQQIKDANAQLVIEGARLRDNKEEVERLTRAWEEVVAARMIAQGADAGIVRENVALMRQNRELERNRELVQQRGDVLQEVLSATEQMYADVAEAEKERTDSLSESIDLQREMGMEILRLTVGAEISAREEIRHSYEERRKLIEQWPLDQVTAHALMLQNEELFVAQMLDIDKQYGATWQGMLEGVLAGYGTAATRAMDMVTAVTYRTEALISDVIFAGITGELDNLDDMFKSFFDSLLREIVNFMAKQAVIKLGKMLLTSFGDGGTTVELANGGVVPGGFRAFATGGVVTTPTLGLVGEGRYNEAVVPLPDGNTIPVQLRGDAAGDREITIHQRILIAPDLLTGGRMSDREIETAVNRSVMRNGEVRRILKTRG